MSSPLYDVPIEDEKKRRLSVSDKVLADTPVPEYEGASALHTINALVTEDNAHEISLRTMSWQRAAWLLAGDQVCLAIGAQAWSFSVLGWVPALFVSIISGLLFWITSITMHKYIMRHPQIKDIAEFGYHIFGGSRIAYVFSSFMFLANNILLVSFHVWTAARVINTLSNHSQCTVVFSVIAALMGIVLSVPRTLRHVSFMSMFSAGCMMLAIILGLVFAAIEKHPGYGYGGAYPKQGPVHTYAFPRAETTWIDCLNALLNITFLWVPQALFPSFIAEMERPQDFPKSLAVLVAISAILFVIPPAIWFHYFGQYSTAPIWGSLASTTYLKGSFAFVIVPTIVIAVIYANPSAKFIYAHIMGRSRHAHSNTIIGWSVWILVMFGIWFIAWVLSNVLPSEADFLSLLGAVFDSFFGFLFFGIAYFHMNRGEFFKGIGRSINTLIHIFVFLVGLFLLGPGFYATIREIMADYSGKVSPAFTCASNAL